MIRKIIKIDQDKCSGCGLCADACLEGAIGMVNGKAVLLRDDYCDGLGNCLPACPEGAISFEEREAAAFDEKAVEEHQNPQPESLPCGCPGTQSRTLGCEAEPAAIRQPVNLTAKTELRQWPVQIKLAPVNAPYFKNASLLVAADCAAYAYGNFHAEFMKNKVTLIGCPKLDDTDYSVKLGEIIRQNDIRSITVVRMEVPCCGGLEHAVKTALQNSGKMIPWRVVTLTADGRILED